MPTRRKCFVTYHHADETHVASFVRAFDHVGDVFVVRRLGEFPQDIVDSADTDYVMRRIREDFIADSTVTLVLAGAGTWARRYVDWEIQASLRFSAGTLPNGLLGVRLPRFGGWPERLGANLGKDSYAGVIDYPTNAEGLRRAIEWAAARRTSHASKIVNPRERFGYNRKCP